VLLLLLLCFLWANATCYMIPHGAFGMLMLAFHHAL
jgi:hypothetical protein